jgi:WD40 repeat protein
MLGKTTWFIIGVLLACSSGPTTIIPGCCSQAAAAEPEPARRLEGLTQNSLGIAFSPDGALVAACGVNDLCIWSTQTGSLLQKTKLKDEATPQPGPQNAAFHLCFSPDGQMLAYCSSEGAVVLGRKEQGFETVKTLVADEACRGVSFTPDGKHLLVGKNDGWNCEVAVFRTADWAKVMTLPGRHYAAEVVPVDPSGRLAASGAGNGVIVWDLSQNGKTVAELKGHDGEVESIAWHPSGKTLAAGDRAHTIIVWDVEKKTVLKRIDTHQSEKSASPLARVEFLVFDPKGKWLAATTLDGMLKIYSAEKELVSMRGGPVGLAVSTDGQWLAVGDGEKPQTVNLWRVADLVGE